MKQFHNILFVSTGVQDDTEVLQHAIKLAHANKATLSILIICPPFQLDLNEYKNSYETFLLEKMHKSIETASSSLSLSKKKAQFKIDFEWGNTPDIRIIQHILRYSYDLLIKKAENDEDTKGFKALDMALLRKCPCTLYLHRPFKPEDGMRIAVAIDPKNEETSGYDLAVELLKLSHTLSTYYHEHLNVISCWDIALENYLRSSIIINISQKEIDDMVMRESNSHYNSLSTLIHEAGIKDQPTIYYLRGNPTEIIPTFLSEQKIDVLIMGTVARTGIKGFIIGNSAENILQKIDCALWTLKPQGFVSPVKY